jgi:hypothetical protein
MKRLGRRGEEGGGRRGLGEWVVFARHDAPKGLMMG